MVEFRRGVRLGIDWGKARIGVAACDPDGVLCHPVETVPHNEARWQRLAQLIAEYEPVELVLGMPIDLAGKYARAADDMALVADEIVSRCDIPLRVVDERMSSAMAAGQLRASGKNAKQQRAMIDQVAAVGILQNAIDTERNTGIPAGRLWQPTGAEDE